MTRRDCGLCGWLAGAPLAENRDGRAGEAQCQDWGKTGERPASALVAAIKAAPKLSAAKDARARVDEWLGEIARTAAGKALKPLLVGDAKSRRAKLAGVVAAIAEASPYLWDLIRADPDRFLRVLQADPEAHFAKVVVRGDTRGPRRARTRPK